MIMLYCQSLKEIRVSTPAENRVGNSSVRKGFDWLESSRVSFTHVIERKSMFVNRYLRYIKRKCVVLELAPLRDGKKFQATHIKQDIATS